MALYLGSEVGDWKGAWRGLKLSVVPGRATREPGTHSHRETFGEDSLLPIFAKPNPVVLDPGLTLRVPRDDSGVPGKRPRVISAL